MWPKLCPLTCWFNPSQREPLNILLTPFSSRFFIFHGQLGRLASPYLGGRRAHTRAAQRRRPLRLNGYDDYDGNGDDRCGSTAGRPAGPHQDGQRAHTRTASGPIPGRPATAAMVTIAAAFTR